jgi:hypothetical protein
MDSYKTLAFSKLNPSKQRSRQRIIPAQDAPGASIELMQGIGVPTGGGRPVVDCRFANLPAVASRAESPERESCMDAEDESNGCV